MTSSAVTGNGHPPGVKAEALGVIDHVLRDPEAVVQGDGVGVLRGLTVPGGGKYIIWGIS